MFWLYMIPIHDLIAIAKPNKFSKRYPKMINSGSERICGESNIIYYLSYFLQRGFAFLLHQIFS